MANIIEANNISKQFKLTADTQTLFRLFKRTITHQPRSRELWALKDINFIVEKGEKIGIIGDNGSGKTTLLRILAGVYRQTMGIINIAGEASNFLQLGAGIKRDLSTLDNIYLIGAIMGLNRGQVNKRLDSIIDFAELKDFIYSPIRDFSTGMIQRLLFSMAKEIDSDIIIMDEILISADANFREKCLKVYEGYKNSDKTLIMASHDMYIIENFCSKALLLDKGKQVIFGPSKEAVDIYINRRF